MPFDLSPWIATPLGLLFLWLGAEGLVRGASAIAGAFGVSKLVIGLTLVAFGTSLPELLVCLQAAWTGVPDVAVGNIVGSNIANVGLIVGIAALLAPLAVGTALLQRDMLWAVGAALLLLVFAWSGLMSRVEGIILLILFGVYMVTLFRAEREVMRQSESSPREPVSIPKQALEGVMLLGGLGLLALGAPLLVDGATSIARHFGISELVIGLTLVAVGTSLPELATAVVAALRGHPEIVLGNVVGSNIFNLLLVLATTAIIIPVDVAGIAAVQDIPVMIGFSVMLFVMALTQRRVTRSEGAVMLALFGVYVTWLFLRGG
jgi:cation:H+ antiporter